MSLFVTVSTLLSKKLRPGQYKLNIAAFDKTTETYGTYEIADLPYLPTGWPVPAYDPLEAACVTPGREHLLDVYSPTPLDTDTPEKLPVIVELHGGGYVTNGKECNRPHGMWFASQGYRVVNVNYTLQPEAMLDLEMREIGCAFRWIAYNADKYGFDLNNVFLTGDSSGGHLALLFTALQTNPKLQELLKCEPAPFPVRGTAVTCPVGSFVDKDIVSSAFRNLAGRIYTDEEKFMYSHNGFIDEHFPGACIVTTDTDVPIHTASENIYKHMKQAGIPHAYKSFEGRSHTLRHVFNVLQPDWEESLEANRFILDYFESKKV